MPDRQEDQPDTRGGRYEPSLNTLSRFDVPEKVVAVEVSGERRPVRGAEVLRSMSRSELQQAIVLREILGPPVSLQ